MVETYRLVGYGIVALCIVGLLVAGCMMWRDLAE